MRGEICHPFVDHAVSRGLLTRCAGTKKNDNLHRARLISYSIISQKKNKSNRFFAYRYSHTLVGIVPSPSAVSEASLFARLRWQKAAASTQGRAGSFLKSVCVAVLHFIGCSLANSCRTNRAAQLNAYGIVCILARVWLKSTIEGYVTDPIR